MEKITVITINYNGKTELEATIQSVIEQNYPSLEYIVIDGGSTDGSLEVIKQYQAFITKWKSEPDKGIYDAMNKGLDMATGDWINFKNSGDRFYKKDTLLSINFSEHNNTDIIYGPSINDYGHVIYDQPLVYSLDLAKLYLGRTMPPHQSSMVRAALYDNYRFPIQYKIAADYDFILKMYLEGKRIVFDANSASLFKMGGVSSKQELLTVKEKYTITKKYLGVGEIFFSYSLLFCEVYFKSILKKNKFLYRSITSYRAKMGK
jgi:glycosyltransferase involved in cell wall biosynthesis